MVKVPCRIPDCDSHSSALLDFFLSLVFVLQCGFQSGIMIMLSQFPFTFHQFTIGCPFHHIVYDYSCADWDSLHDHLRDAPWQDIFKLGVSAAASEFCDWVQVGIDVYIAHCKY